MRGNSLLRVPHSNSAQYKWGQRRAGGAQRVLKKLKGGEKVKRVREAVVSTQRMSEQARDSSQRKEEKTREEQR